jgi:hypothetical protein
MSAHIALLRRFYGRQTEGRWACLGYGKDKADEFKSVPIVLNGRG